MSSPDFSITALSPAASATQFATDMGRITSSNLAKSLLSLENSAATELCGYILDFRKARAAQGIAQKEYSTLKAMRLWGSRPDGGRTFTWHKNRLAELTKERQRLDFAEWELRARAKKMLCCYPPSPRPPTPNPLGLFRPWI